jgi:hypothetical protein
MDRSEDKIDLKMGRDEALVLFEMLADFYEQPALQINLPAERLALIRLHGILEKVLAEPFMPNYLALIEEARLRLGGQFGDHEAGRE